MISFSGRYGLIPLREIQKDSVDDSLFKEDDARYMLVSCSAFVNYLISKYERVND